MNSINKHPLCFSNLVAGERYAHYIPFFLYFAQKEYPEYASIIFYRGNFPPDLAETIRKIADSNSAVFPESFAGVLGDTADHTKILRWLMRSPLWERFHSVYMSYIDLLPIRETPTLYERKTALCEKYLSPYYNTTGVDDVITRGFRMTGIHFFKTDEYLTRIQDAQIKYFDLLRTKTLDEVNGFVNDTMGRVDNQHALFNLIKESNLPIILDAEGWEYNGIHLGHSRVKGRWEELLRTDPAHRRYWEGFKKYLDDSVFLRLLENTIPEIRFEFDELIKAGKEFDA